MTKHDIESPRNRRRGAGLIVVILILALGITGLIIGDRGLAPRSPETSPPERSWVTDIPVRPYVGYRAPDFTLKTLAGESVTLSHLAGQVVILDFWASWCGPCKASMPQLHALWQSVKEQGVVLVGVSLDRTEDAARTYLESTDVADMIALWSSLSDAQGVAESYRVAGIPHTLVIDRTGIIRYANHPALLRADWLNSVL